MYPNPTLSSCPQLSDDFGEQCPQYTLCDIDRAARKRQTYQILKTSEAGNDLRMGLSKLLFDITQRKRGPRAKVGAVNIFTIIAQSVIFTNCPGRFKRKALRWASRLSESPFLYRGTYGLLYFLRAPNLIDRHIVECGIFEKEEVAALVQEVKQRKADMFIDIGGNIGVYAMAVAKETNCPEIVSFEPDSLNRAQFGANLFLNRLEGRIRVCEEAISDKEGSATLYLSRAAGGADKENTGMSSLETMLLQREAPSATVHTRRLDDIFGHLRQRSIVIKMDIEGHEAHALAGMKTVIANNEVFLQIEILPQFAERTRSVLKELDLTEMPQVMAGSCDFMFVTRRCTRTTSV